ncbi:tRNA pseudouridine(55) synthase TruB [Candidatus Saccharibacteria bacterium TM7i]|nr:tRNA pseudouridine(55) synthase TruB [Candidatus Saccharibacteria bacterium TM7i]
MLVLEEHSVQLVDKPAGITSFGVVARVRRRLSEVLGKKAKVGHTGTLDPFATGLMIIVTGKECRNAMQYSKLDKEYEATICLGQTSSTGDPEGEITDVSDVVPTDAAVQAALEQFTGEIKQRPPIFSAIKINGRRAYDLARKGEAVEMPERTVTIHALELIDYTYPNLRIRTHVSSGTYIRTLAEDIGKVLDTGAYCSELRRTKVGWWGVEDATPIEK